MTQNLSENCFGICRRQRNHQTSGLIINCSTLIRWHDDAVLHLQFWIAKQRTCTLVSSTASLVWFDFRAVRLCINNQCIISWSCSRRKSSRWRPGQIQQVLLSCYHQNRHAQISSDGSSMTLVTRRVCPCDKNNMDTTNRAACKVMFNLEASSGCEWETAFSPSK